MAKLCGLHDQIRHLQQIAQFQQVPTHMEVGVVLLYFGVQQCNAVCRALQPLVDAHDAHVVPHEATQFIPVVRDQHRLIDVSHLAVVPGG